MTMLIDEAGDSYALKRTIFDALVGDLYFHQQVKDALSAAGLDVLRVSKPGQDGIWEVRMKACTCDLSFDPVLSARQIRRFLSRAGIRIDSKAIEVRQSKDRISVGFNFRFGAAGVVRESQ